MLAPCIIYGLVYLISQEHTCLIYLLCFQLSVTVPKMVRPGFTTCFHTKSSEDLENNEKPEVDEEFNQDKENDEDLLDIPTFLRRQAN